MRILLVNKFYYLRGGDCTAVFQTERLLKDKGHEVAVFCMQYPENIASEWEKYFPKEVDFASPSGIAGKVSAVMRIFYSSETAVKFKKILTDFQPDVVHLHNIHSYISPSVAQIAHQKGIRVVWTLHDYKLICPVYTCLRNGQTCEACFGGKWNVVRHRCMKGSYAASVLACLESCYWNMNKLSRITGTFISPSVFLKTKMTEAGFAAEQIEVLPNFLPHPYTPSAEKEDYYCYTGRLTEEKGVDGLLEAASQLPYPLKIIGGGRLLEAFQKKFSSKKIEFYGRLSHEQLYPIVQKARFLVLPSVWYENNPYSAIEALCMGTPVLGARIGGIPELIAEGQNGFLFRAGDIPDLTRKIGECFRYFAESNNFQQISTDAQNKFSAETFYHKLMKIYNV